MDKASGDGASNQEDKVLKIMHFFRFRTVKDAVLGMHRVLKHPLQERTNNPPLANEVDIVEEVYSRIEQKRFWQKYQPPLGTCVHFSNLLFEICKKLGHACEIHECHPDYLNGNKHWIVFDTTAGKFYDPTLYQSWFVHDHWERTKPENMIAIPPEVVHTGRIMKRC